jgi:hypothetical protein
MDSVVFQSFFSNLNLLFNHIPNPFDSFSSNLWLSVCMDRRKPFLLEHKSPKHHVIVLSQAVDNAITNQSWATLACVRSNVVRILFGFSPIHSHVYIRTDCIVVAVSIVHITLVDISHVAFIRDGESFHWMGLFCPVTGTDILHREWIFKEGTTNGGFSIIDATKPFDLVF